MKCIPFTDQLLHKQGKEKPAIYSALGSAGMFAGAVQTAVSTPVDLLKIRQQLQRVPPGSPHYVGPLQLLRRILAREGLPGDLVLLLSSQSTPPSFAGWFACVFNALGQYAEHALRSLVMS